MCGRTACTLCKEDIQEATRQYSETNELPKWVEKYPWQTYSPVYNLAPTDNIPVLLKEKLINPEEKGGDLAIVPMRWGMVPSWFKGFTISDFPNSNHNCRSETILKRPTFRGAFLSGKRCVVLADGFYEWKDSGKTPKVPYFIHFPNENGIKMHERSFENENFRGDDGQWHGPRLLTMAGIFDLWRSLETGPICSCSVLTMESSKMVSCIHDRMPAILDGVDQVKMWLNSGQIPAEVALGNLKPVEKLAFYQVKTVVNSTKNKTVECVKPFSSKSIGKCFESESKQSTQMTLETMFESARAKRIKVDPEAGKG